MMPKGPMAPATPPTSGLGALKPAFGNKPAQPQVSRPDPMRPITLPAAPQTQTQTMQGFQPQPPLVQQPMPSAPQTQQQIAQMQQMLAQAQQRALQDPQVQQLMQQQYEQAQQQLRQQGIQDPQAAQIFALNQQLQAQGRPGMLGFSPEQMQQALQGQLTPPRQSLFPVRPEDQRMQAMRAIQMMAQRFGRRGI